MNILKNSLVDIICSGGDSYTEEHLYQLFQHTITYKLKVGVKIEETIDHARRWTFNVFPFSLGNLFKTELELNGKIFPVTLYKRELIELSVEIDNWMTTFLTIAVIDIKNMAKSLYSKTCSLILEQKQCDSFLREDTLTFEISIAHGVGFTTTKEQETFLYNPERCGTVVRAEGEKERYVWRFPYSSHEEVRYSPPFYISAAQYYLRVTFPGVYIIQAVFDDVQMRTVGCLFRNFKDPLGSLYFAQPVYSDNHSSFGSHAEANLDDFLQNGKMELYLSSAGATPSYGYDYLPEDIQKAFVNSHVIPDVSHHGFVEVVNNQKLYRFLNAAIIKYHVSGVLQPTLDPLNFHITVTLIHAESDDCNIAIGLASPGFSVGMVGLSNDSIGLQTNGWLVHDCEGLAQTDPLHAGDAVEVYRMYSVTQFSVNGKALYTSNTFPKDFVPTITGCGYSFSLM